MVAPTIIGLIVLNLWPFVQTVYTSFCEHLGFGHYKFIGLANYAEMFQTPEFWKATWNTVLFCILTVPVGLFLSLLVAMLLNAKIKFKGGFRTIFFLPMVCAPAAVTMVWRWIFNGEYGILNQALGAKIGWITDPKFVMISCAIVAIWSNIGYDAVLLLAGLQNISKSYYEAASIDGAGKGRQFFDITLPLLKGVIKTSITFWSINTTTFFLWTKMFSPIDTESSTIVPVIYLYDMVFGGKGITTRDAGAGAAVGVVLTLIIIAVYLITEQLFKGSDLEY